MKMEVDVLSVGRAIALAVGIATVVALVLLAWIGGEMHYRNCIAGVEARYPVGGTEVGKVSGEPRPGSYLAERRDATASCSRWP